MSETRVLRLFTTDAQGNEIPWHITVDERSFVVDERRGYAEINADKIALDTVRPDQRRYIEDLIRRGITFEINSETGGILITGVPQMEQDLSRFFVLESPCDFPECEQLRIEWQAAVKELRDSSDLECDLRCAEGKLQRQFMEKIRPFVEAAKHTPPNEQNTSTGNSEVSPPSTPAEA